MIDDDDDDDDVVWEGIEVREAMTPTVETTPPRATLAQAAAQMAERAVGLLVVVDDGVAIGVLTDRDIVVRSIARGEDPRRTLVEQAMTPSVLSCLVEDTVDDAVQTMTSRAVRRLIVVDGGGQPIGVLSVDDIASRLHDSELAGDVVRGAAEPSGDEQ